MGIVAIYQKPNTSIRHLDHKIHPYLLRNLNIDRANQVWCADIVYIPMAKGFLCLVAMMNWFSRRVPAWRLSITLEAEFRLKYEEVFTHAYGSVAAARLGINAWMHFYNDQRKRQALGYRTPSETFSASIACEDMHNASALHTSSQALQSQTERTSIDSRKVMITRLDILAG